MVMMNLVRWQQVSKQCWCLRCTLSWQANPRLWTHLNIIHNISIQTSTLWLRQQAAIFRQNARKFQREKISVLTIPLSTLNSVKNGDFQSAQILHIGPKFSDKPKLRKWSNWAPSHNIWMMLNKYEECSTEWWEWITFSYNLEPKNQ